MQKKYITVILCFTFWVCRADKLVLQGEMGALKAEKAYLCEVVNELREQYRVVDSAVVRKGRFVFTKEGLKPELYFLKINSHLGGYLFLEPVVMSVKPGEIRKDKINWITEGGALDCQYRHFGRERDSVCRQQLLDSMNALFYQAREEGKKQEMARIKAESMPYYDRASENEAGVVWKWINENRDNALGIYLYYTNVFCRSSFPVLKNIERERKYLSGFINGAHETRYMQRMEEKLALAADCAIGAVAPEISGLDTLGNPMKLSDLRGNYVVVDFWNSYCHWCREETPWLQNVMAQFKDRNFKILGVSSDRVAKLWTNAIREDESHWNHLILKKGDIVMERYGIKGVPHIILIDPEGRILAKELRREGIRETVVKYMDEGKEK